ncbi:RluA family pseudouridine synthase [Lyngbya sp. CCY1209]|uniref:RluA family pseudouridine synthase n=1 Tax=Lyngbya sp. CCY1209 TaxID=2886103 RepID=UPI002D212F54|nr:RluA family pseudouridine synthase [Lyngbya sp. CCY1209]MEB3886892.1 RluA family pseudouridine synthase [Lyngbya sp. CCY1209]
MATPLNSGWTYRDRVDRKSAGLTVLDYYAGRYRHSTEMEWRDRLDAGQIWLDGKPAIAEMRLQPGQELVYHRPPWKEPDVPLFFQVLYEDADLLVVAKPSGLPVMPGGGFLEHTLLGQLQRRYPEETPVPIHRLGRGTSGLVLLARSQTARSHLTRQMRDRQIGKVYLALASGCPDRDEFGIDRAIGKIPHPVLGYIYGAAADGLFARSDCRVLKRCGDRAIIEVTILTGRPHQIRIHLAAAGFPLVGDPLYEIGGKPRSPEGDTVPVPGDCGYWLHAYSLSFRHPKTGATLRITAPPPPELRV